MRVVKLARKGGVVVQDCDVYIGRACNMGGWRLKQSKWYNPFSAKSYGREACIGMYEDYIKANPELIKALPELEGKTLGCWCKPQACHGDVLVRLVKEQAKNKKQTEEAAIPEATSKLNQKNQFLILQNSKKTLNHK